VLVLRTLRPVGRLALAAGVALAVVPRPAPAAEGGPPPAAEVSAEVDRLVLARLAQLGIEPAPLCSDETFVRRVFLDAIGTLPTLGETRAFLVSRSEGKRAALVERLLAREEFADYWAMKWCNLLRVKSEFPINLWPNAVQAYHRWIRESLRGDVAYDAFANALLTSSGSNFRAPPVNFWRAVPKRDPTSLAKAVALTFLATRAERWPKERLDGLAAFFSRVGTKTTAEWKEEIVFFDAAKAGAPASGVLPDGTTVAFSRDRDPRQAFAEWLTDPRNPWFARGLANRTWSWLLGHGIVHEPDDLRPDNPPSNPELLARLERDLVASRFDPKRLFRVVLGSKTYQRSSVPASPDPRAEREFACYAVRRLEPEVLIDAVNQVTGTTEEYASKVPEPFTVMPVTQRAIGLADASVTSPFLELFGRSARDTGLESEQRASLPTEAQALHLLNSTHVRQKVVASPALRSLLATAGRGPVFTGRPVEETGRPVLDALFLTVLARRPVEEDLRALDAYPPFAESRPGLVVDVAWALINGAEFQHRH
jgi:hypothetical protein